MPQQPRPIPVPPTATPNVTLQYRDDGSLMAVYVSIQNGRVADTRELREGVLYADYGTAGELLGIEILGPIEVSVVTSLAGLDQSQGPFSRIIEGRATEFIRGTTAA